MIGIWITHEHVRECREQACIHRLGPKLAVWIFIVSLLRDFSGVKSHGWWWNLVAGVIWLFDHVISGVASPVHVQDVRWKTWIHDINLYALLSCRLLYNILARFNCAYQKKPECPLAYIRRLIKHVKTCRINPLYVQDIWNCTHCFALLSNDFTHHWRQRLIAGDECILSPGKLNLSPRLRIQFMSSLDMMV